MGEIPLRVPVRCPHFEHLFAIQRVEVGVWTEPLDAAFEGCEGSNVYFDVWACGGLKSQGVTGER